MNAGQFATLLTACIVLGMAGCSTAPVQSTGVLSAEERAMAEALARFSEGLYYESQEPPDKEGALAAFQSALELDPDEPDLRALAAKILLDLSRPEEAFELMRKAALDLPDSPEIRRSLAKLALHCEQFEIAAKEFLACFEISENDPERREMLRMAAYSWFRLKRDQDSLRVLLQLAQYRGDVPTGGDADSRTWAIGHAINSALGLAAERLKEKEQTESAVSYVEWAVEIAEDRFQQADIMEAFAVSAMQNGNFALAARYFRLCVSYDSFRSSAFMMSSRLQDDGSRKEVTIESLQKRLDAGQTEPGIYLALTYLLNRAERYSESLPHLLTAIEEWKEANPERQLPENIYLLHGSTLERSNRLDESEAVFRKALEQYPDSAIMLNYLAYMLAEQKRNLEEAESMVRRALEHEPENHAFLDTLGWIFFQQGHYEKALTWLLRAAQGEPKNAEILDHLGDAFASLGRIQEAIPCWKMSLHLEPEREEVRAKLEAAEQQTTPGEQSIRSPTGVPYLIGQS